MLCVIVKLQLIRCNHSVVGLCSKCCEEWTPGGSETVETQVVNPLCAVDLVNWNITSDMKNSVQYDVASIFDKYF